MALFKKETEKKGKEVEVEDKKMEKTKEAKPKKVTRKKKTEKTEKKAGEGEKSSTAKSAQKAGISPHVTEKATFLNAQNAYVFKIEPSFNKIMVREAVKKAYGVTPLKVSIINIPPRMVFIRGRKSEKLGHKKAVVYLKKGETIKI